MYTYICNKALKKGKSSAFSDDFYNSLKTEFAGVKCGEKIKSENTSGQCYYYSLLLAKSMPGSTLIIGALNNINSTVRNEYYNVFGHGWVEKDGLVYDTTSRQVFNKDWYYDKFNASVKESYKSEELSDPDLFFRLGVNAIKDRSFLVKPLFEIIKPDLSKIYANPQNVSNSLSVVHDELILKELNKYTNPTMKK